jgi:hypothetical protein
MSGKSGVGAGKRTNMVSNSTVSQGGTGGSSARQATSVGSGARPGKGKMQIPSSNPSQSQMIRPKNRVEGTGYKG